MKPENQANKDEGLTALKYIVEGYKWFDKKNGNTYHNISIIDVKSRELIYQSGLTYGYGEQWKHTAITGLIKLGLFEEKNRHNHDLIRSLIYFADCNENALYRDIKGKEIINETLKAVKE